MKVRRGVCRTVYLVGPWAIKVPGWRSSGRGIVRGRIWCFAHGVLANLSEREWSAYLTNVAPVLFSLGVINVYRRCDPVTEFDGDYLVIEPDLPARDCKVQNLGLLGGRIVWVDYDVSFNGCPHERWSP